MFNFRGPEILILIALVALAVWLLFIRPSSRRRKDEAVSLRVQAIRQPVIDSAAPIDQQSEVTSADTSAAGHIGYRRADNTFHGSLGTVVQYATLAINDLQWTITGASEMTRTLTFETRMSVSSWSGLTVTLSFFEVAPNVWRVSGSGKSNVRGAQLVAPDLLGSVQTAIARVLTKMQAVAPAIP